MRYEARAELQIESQRLLSLKAGDAVSLGRRDTTWPGWCWVTDEAGESAWMHESMFESTAKDRAIAKEPYRAQELSVRKGDILKSLRELGGWHWCRKVDGTEGWTPAYNLRPVDEETL